MKNVTGKSNLKEEMREITKNMDVTEKLMTNQIDVKEKADLIEKMKMTN